MKLGVKMLEGDSTINNLRFKNQLEFIPGETGTVMFQLIDASSGNRYIPISGSTVTATIHSSNSANVLTKPSTQSFADDRSIWSFNLTSADTNKMAGINMTITLTEGSNVKIARAEGVIVMAPKSMFQC